MRTKLESVVIQHGGAPAIVAQSNAIAEVLRVGEGQLTQEQQYNLTRQLTMNKAILDHLNN